MHSIDLKLENKSLKSAFPIPIKVCCIKNRTSYSSKTFTEIGSIFNASDVIQEILESSVNLYLSTNKISEFFNSTNV